MQSTRSPPLPLRLDHRPLCQRAAQLLLCGLLASGYGAIGQVAAADDTDYTVCASGCTATTISAIMTGQDLGCGDTIEVQADTVGGSKTYTETVSIGSGDGCATAGKTVLFYARSGDNITIDGESTRANCFALSTDRLTIQGFICTGTTGAGLATVSGVDYYRILDNTFHDLAGSGLDLYAGIGGLVDGNTFYNIPGNGILLRNAATVDLEISNNIMYDINTADSAGDGIDMSGTTIENVWIHHNTINHTPSTTKSAILVTSSGTVTIEDNIITYSNIGIKLTAGTMVIRRNKLINISADVSYGIFCGETDEGAGSITNNIFVDQTTDLTDAIYLYDNAFNVYNNTIYNASICLSMLGTPTINWKGNICLSPSARHINSAAGYTLDASNNIYYPEFTDCFNLGGTEYSTLATYASGETQEAYSSALDPLLVSPASSEFRPTAKSYAIGHGLDLSLTSDYRGRPIPHAGGYDIGALGGQRYIDVTLPTGGTP